MHQLVRRIAPAAAVFSLLVVACGSRASVGVERESLAVKVNVATCDGDASGSGFFFADNRIVTNRHVVDEARSIEIEFSDGHAFPVSELRLSATRDLAELTVPSISGRPLTIGVDPTPGDDTWVVGFPLGGPALVTTGRVVDTIDGNKFDVSGSIIRTRADVDPGNSGGPMLDGQNRVVGIVFAVEYSSGWGMAIPVSALAQLNSVGATTPMVTSC
jgi:S1-C subfamily serine protease